MSFKKSKGENVPDKYGDAVKNIMANLSFKWNDDYSGYFFTSKDSITLMDKLVELNQEILKQ